MTTHENQEVTTYLSGNNIRLEIIPDISFHLVVDIRFYMNYLDQALIHYVSLAKEMRTSSKTKNKI